jgi:predicted Rossmann fold nucleotide-binding protein DprA/Smf involved in DNA uptake
MNTSLTRADIVALNDEVMDSMNKADLKNYLATAVRILQATPEKNGGRKEEVLNLLREGPMDILTMAERLNTSTKNISSQLSYLRKDGHILHTDHLQRKVLIIPPQE